MSLNIDSILYQLNHIQTEIQKAKDSHEAAVQTTKMLKDTRDKSGYALVQEYSKEIWELYNEAMELKKKLDSHIATNPEQEGDRTTQNRETAERIIEYIKATAYSCVEPTNEIALADREFHVPVKKHKRR